MAHPTTLRLKASSTTARYYDPNSGKTWTGRGKAPRWIAGQDYTNFLIPAEGILRKMAQQVPAGA